MFRQVLREIPFLRFFIPFITGIIIASSFIKDGIAQRYVAFYLCLLLLFLIYLFTFRRLYKRFNATLIHLIFCCCGFLITLNHYRLLNHDHFSKIPSSYLMITADEVPVIKEKWVRFRARIIRNEKGEKLSGYLLVYLQRDSLSESLSYGNDILIKSNSSEVKSPENPGAFDYRAFLASKNIFHQQFVRQHEWRNLHSFSGNRIVSISNSIAAHLIKIFRKQLKDDEVFNVASALVIGYRADLSPDIVNSYANTGTLHILSVSGLHVGIIYVVLHFLFSFLDRTKQTRSIKSFILVFLVWLYALISGFSSSVCRSAMMISFMIIAKSFNRSTNMYNVIFASAFLLLIYDPFFLSDIGFLLSYLAVISIIYFQPKIYHLFIFQNKWIDKIWLLTSVSIAAQIGTFPVSLYFFHQFPNYFLVANLLAIPLATGVLYIGILLLALAWIPVVSTWVAWLLHYNIKIMDAILVYIESLPMASFKRIWINTFELWTIYAVMFLFMMFFVYRYRTMFKYILVLCIILVSARLHIQFRALQQNKLIVLNVPKKIIAVRICGTYADVFSSVTLTERDKLFYTEPLLGLYHIRNENYDTASFLVFDQHKIFIMPEHKIIPAWKYLKVDYLLTDHKKPNAAMFKHIEFDTLICTAYLDENRFQKLKAQSEKEGKNFFSTSRQGVFVSSKY